MENYVALESAGGGIVVIPPVVVPPFWRNTGTLDIVNVVFYEEDSPIYINPNRG